MFTKISIIFLAVSPFGNNIGWDTTETCVSKIMKSLMSLHWQWNTIGLEKEKRGHSENSP